MLHPVGCPVLAHLVIHFSPANYHWRGREGMQSGTAAWKPVVSDGMGGSTSARTRAR